jgi:hypothetical protein
MDPILNFERLLRSIPSLSETLTQINNVDICFGLYAGAYVSVMTSNRPAKDVDFLVADEDIEKTKALFPGCDKKEMGATTFLYPFNEHRIELMSGADYDIADSHYLFRLTQLAWEHTTVLKGKDFKVRLCNPIDTILLKAMLQRGVDQGKHDREDIEDLLKVVTVDRSYLTSRLAELNPDERLHKALKGLKLL